MTAWSAKVFARAGEHHHADQSALSHQWEAQETSVARELLLRRQRVVGISEDILNVHDAAFEGRASGD